MCRGAGIPGAESLIPASPLPLACSPLPCPPLLYPSLHSPSLLSAPIPSLPFPPATLPCLPLIPPALRCPALPSSPPLPCSVLLSPRLPIPGVSFAVTVFPRCGPSNPVFCFMALGFSETGIGWRVHVGSKGHLAAGGSGWALIWDVRLFQLSTLGVVAFWNDLSCVSSMCTGASRV